MSEPMKLRLAQAMNQCMKKASVENITIKEICFEANCSRQTFYRCFKDKYDLANWIFDIECISAITRQQSADRWALMEVLIFYFYENKTFYRKIIKLKGQNSFSEHFREFLYPIIRKRLDDIVEPSVKRDFMTDFLTDTCICAIESWLSEKECMPPEQLMHVIKSLTESVAISLCSEMN